MAEQHWQVEVDMPVVKPSSRIERSQLFRPIMQAFRQICLGQHDIIRKRNLLPAFEETVEGRATIQDIKGCDDACEAEMPRHEMIPQPHGG